MKDVKKWKDVSVNFIKFETAKEDDRRTLDQVSRLWGGKNLSSAIADEANILGGNAHIYGVTTQESNFDHVDPSQVLGFVSTDKFTKKLYITIWFNVYVFFVYNLIILLICSFASIPNYIYCNNCYY